MHGIEIIPELNKGYTSDDLDRAVTVFDRNTLKLLKVIKYTGSADLAQVPSVPRRAVVSMHRLPGRMFSPYRTLSFTWQIAGRLAACRGPRRVSRTLSGRNCVAAGQD